MRIGLDESIFHRFPSYRRGLVVARGMVNSSVDAELETRLRRAEEGVRGRLGDRWKSDPRVAVWLEAFRQLGMNPTNRPPAIAALVKRVSKGWSLPFINTVVSLMNVTSLEHLVPCGGDDLRAVQGGLMLRPAQGDERYRPLGQPDLMERPEPGELVLVDTAGEVLCRSWCWRNSDVTKLTLETTSFALNVDLMGPVVAPEEGAAITEQLAADVRRRCGGDVEWHVLAADSPVVDVTIW